MTKILLAKFHIQRYFVVLIPTTGLALSPPTSGSIPAIPEFLQGTRWKPWNLDKIKPCVVPAPTKLNKLRGKLEKPETKSSPCKREPLPGIPTGVNPMGQHSSTASQGKSRIGSSADTELRLKAHFSSPEHPKLQKEDSKTSTDRKGAFSKLIYWSRCCWNPCSCEHC